MLEFPVALCTDLLSNDSFSGYYKSLCFSHNTKSVLCEMLYIKEQIIKVAYVRHILKMKGP